RMALVVRICGVQLAAGIGVHDDGRVGRLIRAAGGMAFLLGRILVRRVATAAGIGGIGADRDENERSRKRQNSPTKPARGPDPNPQHILRSPRSTSAIRLERPRSLSLSSRRPDSGKNSPPQSGRTILLMVQPTTVGGRNCQSVNRDFRKIQIVH